MKPHTAIMQWPTKCPQPHCPNIVRTGGTLFFDDTDAYCSTCYNRYQHCAECGTTLTGRHDVDTDCWTCANFHNGRNIAFIDGHRVTYHPNREHPDSPWVSVDEPRRFSFSDEARAYSVIYAPEGR